MTSTAGTFYAPTALLRALQREPIQPAAGSGGFLLQALPTDQPGPVLINPPFEDSMMPDVNDNAYRASLIRAVNADTLEAMVHLGFDVSIEAVIQLRGLDLPEPHEEGGKEARQITVAAIPSYDLVLANPEKDGFGRWVCDVFLVTGASLADVIRLRMPEVQA